MKSPLIIRQLRAKLAVSDRMLEWRQTKLKENEGSPGSLQFVSEEVSFLKAAQLAMKYHEASLRPETSIVLALRELVDELDRLELPGQIPDHDELHRLVTKARRVLREVTE